MEKIYEISSGPKGYLDDETLIGGTEEEALFDYFHHHRDHEEINLTFDEWLIKHQICLYLCNEEGDILEILREY